MLTCTGIDSSSCVQLGDVVMLRAALFITAFAMALNGVWGLKAYYADACTGFDICTEDSVVAIADTMAPAIVGLSILGFVFTFFGKLPDEDRPYSAMQ